ncbi:MAG: hypothetical protein JWR18_2536 [Segetibacter sp.]|nr:hypothetical protein [Segetibacter sp.]
MKVLFNLSQRSLISSSQNLRKEESQSAFLFLFKLDFNLGITTIVSCLYLTCFKASAHHANLVYSGKLPIACRVTI